MSPLGCLIGISSLMSSDWTLDLYHQVCSFSFLVLVNGTFIQPQVQGPCWCLHFCMPLSNLLWNPVSLTAWICIDLHLFLHLRPPPSLSLRWHNSLITHVSLGIPHFMALCVIMLCRFIVFFSFFFLSFFFFFFKNWRFVATFCQASLLAPFFQQHLLIHVSISHFGNSCNISKFSILLYLLKWFVISDFWCYYHKKIMLHWGPDDSIFL